MFNYLFNMTPTFTTDKEANSLFRYIEGSCQRCFGFAFGKHLSNDTNIIFRQFCVRMLRTFKARDIGATFCGRVLHVLFVATQEQMAWVHASRIIAMMANFLPIWNGAVVKFIAKSVRVAWFATRSKRSIPFVVEASLPKPTFISRSLFYLAPKAFVDGAGDSRRMVSYVLRLSTWIFAYRNGLPAPTLANGIRIAGLKCSSWGVTESKTNGLTFDMSQMWPSSFCNGGGLTTSTFTKFWGIIGVHKKSPFLCHATGRSLRRGGNSIGFLSFNYSIFERVTQLRCFSAERWKCHPAYEWSEM